MLVYFDHKQNAIAQTKGRYHPWTITMATPDGRYIDFKANPETIGEGLEDLRHIKGTALEGAFVDFFGWANGPNCVFETNDFGLRPQKKNESGVSTKSLEQLCRLTIFFRDLHRNTEAGDLIAFAHRMEISLREIAPNFDQACWGWSLWPHLFTALGDENDPAAVGKVIQYNAWSWGDTSDEVQTNMIRALAILKEALCSTATSQKNAA